MRERPDIVIEKTLGRFFVDCDPFNTVFSDEAFLRKLFVTHSTDIDHPIIEFLASIASSAGGDRLLFAAGGYTQGRAVYWPSRPIDAPTAVGINAHQPSDRCYSQFQSWLGSLRASSHALLVTCDDSMEWCVVHCREQFGFVAASEKYAAEVGLGWPRFETGPFTIKVPATTVPLDSQVRWFLEHMGGAGFSVDDRLDWLARLLLAQS